MLTSNKYRLEKLIEISEMIERCDRYIAGLKDNKRIIPSVFYSVIEHQQKGILKYEAVKARLTKYYNSIISKLAKV